MLCFISQLMYYDRFTVFESCFASLEQVARQVHHLSINWACPSLERQASCDRGFRPATGLRPDYPSRSKGMPVYATPGDSLGSYIVDLLQEKVLTCSNVSLKKLVLNREPQTKRACMPADGAGGTGGTRTQLSRGLDPGSFPFIKLSKK